MNSFHLPAWREHAMLRDVPECMHPVFGMVDDTIKRLSEKKFQTDPIVAPQCSAITSIVSSAYKRHGQIIEQAIIAALSETNHLRVWSEPRFCVSEAADRLADAEVNATGASLAYNAQCYKRTLQIDLLVYNERAKRIGYYESKRGFGYHDAGKKRSMLRDLLCVRMLLRSYAEDQGFPVHDVAAHMIFYYGQCSLKKPWALTRQDLDDHFSTSVSQNVELINAYFRDKLHELLASIASL